MRPKKPEKAPQDDLFLVRPDQLLDLRHERCRLQLPSHPQVVEGFVVQSHRRDPLGYDTNNTNITNQNRFLAID